MVRELDMTQTAYMEIPRGFGRPLRITSRTIAVHGHSRETVTAAGYSIINRIMAELHISNGIVWWRLRPEVEDRGLQDAVGAKVEYRFLFRSRLATSPELPDALWDEVAKPEGLPVTLSPETVWAQTRDPLAGEESELYSEEADFGPEYDQHLGLNAYTDSNMQRLRKTTLNGQAPNFGCAQYVPPGVEVLGQTPIVATLGNAKQKRKTGAVHGGSKPRPRVRKKKRHTAVRRKGLQ